MKKLLASLLILCMLSAFPLMADANVVEAPEQSVHILSSVYDGILLTGAVEAPDGTFWVRCTFFIVGGSYFVLSLPIDADGHFELHISASCVGIAVEITDNTNVQPAGPYFDSAMVKML